MNKATLAVVLKDPVNTDVGAVLAHVRIRAPVSRGWLNPLGIDNGFAIVVRGSNRITTLSEAADAERATPGLP